MGRPGPARGRARADTRARRRITRGAWGRLTLRASTITVYDQTHERTRSPRQRSDLIAIAYPDLETARGVASRLGEASKGHLLDIDDLVLVERRDDGKIKLHQPSLAGMSALGGAAWGGLIGLLFLVPFLGIAVGAATGAAAGALSDAGIDDNFMKDLGASLEPGTAALVALVRNANMDRLLEQAQVPGKVLRTSLSGDDEEHLRERLESVGS